ncbi:MAG: serine/threonine protein kinase [Deltaproteobacteria bacterium]|nr:serine/threonine protein kinase [Deltaproteobacteria bacterium]
MVGSSHQPSTTDPLIGQLVHGRYRVIKRVGAGSMGFIHEVEHVVIGRKFALKTLQPAFARDPRAIKRFQREARAAALVGHEGIVSVTDMGLLDDATGTPFLVMELLQGATLGEELEKVGPLTIARAIAVTLSCCSALSAAHKRGIVHRDIKPDNIFLAQDAGRRETVKIVDFGISRVREALGLADSHTLAGSVLGTPYYMSPEQFEGKPDVDERADVYALGVVLFQMLAGRVPFEAPNITTLMMQVLTGPPPSLKSLVPSIPDDLDRALQNAMATQREKRTPSMDAFADALRPVLARYADSPGLAGDTSTDGATGFTPEAALGTTTPAALPHAAPAAVPSWVDEPTEADPEVVRRAVSNVLDGADGLSSMGTLIGVGARTLHDETPTVPEAAEPAVSPRDVAGESGLSSRSPDPVRAAIASAVAAPAARSSVPGGEAAGSRWSEPTARVARDHAAGSEHVDDAQSETARMDLLDLAPARSRDQSTWMMWVGVGLMLAAVVALAVMLATR